MDHMEPLIVKALLQSKLVMDVDIPEVYSAGGCAEKLDCQ